MKGLKNCLSEINTITSMLFIHLRFLFVFSFNATISHAFFHIRI